MCGFKIMCMYVSVCVFECKKDTQYNNIIQFHVEKYLNVPSGCCSPHYTFFLFHRCRFFRRFLLIFFYLFRVIFSDTFSYKFFNKQFFLLCCFFLFQQILYTPCVVLCLLNIKYVTLLMLLLLSLK